MATDANRYNIDPHLRAIPGQSLTDPPGRAPYEKPALTSSVKDALEGILEGMHDPIRQEGLVQVLSVGMSAETVASSIVMRAFSDGMFTPDVAELIKPALIVSLVGIAYDNDITDVRVLNNPIDTPVDPSEFDELKSRMSLTDEEQGEEVDPFDAMFAEDEGEEDVPMDMEPQGFMNREEGSSMDMPEQGFINRDEPSMMEGQV
jgi:hypothetical protein